MPNDTLNFRCRFLIILFGLSLLLFYNGGEKWVLTRHEVLAAEPAREMLHYGNWIIPTIGDVARYNKPPTTGWLIAACMFVFGSESEWVARLPSALAAVGTALVMAVLTARYFGRLAGVIAGLMQTTFFYTLMQARLAEADIILGLTSAIALHAFAVAHIEGPYQGRCGSRWRPVVFYGATGFAFLLKGFVGPLMISGAAVMYLIWTRDRGVVRFLLSPWGLALFAVLVTAWPVAAYAQDPAIYQYWVREQFGRFRGEIKQSTAGSEDARESVLFYLYIIPGLLLPWVLYVVPAMVRGRQLGVLGSPLARLLLCWVIPGLVLLSATAFKAKHYAIPLLPPFTVVCAVGLLAFIGERERKPEKNPRLLAAIWTLSFVGVAIGVWKFTKIAPVQTAVLPVIILLGGLAYMFAERRRSRLGQIGAVFGTAWLVGVCLQWLVMPHHDLYRPSARFAQRASARIPASQPVYLLGLGESHISYYTRLPFRRVDDVEGIRALFTSGQGPEWVIAKASLVPVLSSLGVTVETVDESPKISRSESVLDRPLLLRLTRVAPG